MDKLIKPFGVSLGLTVFLISVRLDSWWFSPSWTIAFMPCIINFLTFCTKAAGKVYNLKKLSKQKGMIALNDTETAKIIHELWVLSVLSFVQMSVFLVPFKLNNTLDWSWASILTPFWFGLVLCSLTGDDNKYWPQFTFYYKNPDPFNPNFFSKMFILYLFAQSFTLAFNQEYLSFLEVPSSLISSSTTNTTTPIDEWTMFVLSSPTWFIFSLMNLGMWLQKDIRFPEKVWINILFIVFCLYIFSVLMKIMESSAIIQDDVGIILYIVNKLWFVFYLSPFYALGISASLQ
eukprot:TRINITY_DN6558_c0_g1_i1.p1 TRINITY_DN6558_c0_g1~~TRINITY_DN6558_c0_g1_i1.p1  ORF type:complete len:290 (+),score=16.93 TRINITY_DN6558_c0_g1_i1:2-871(+)